MNTELLNSFAMKNTSTKNHVAISIEDFKNICRFCLFGAATDNLFKIEHEGTTLYHFCESQLSIMLSTADGLPTNICKQCTNRIKEIAAFKMKITESEDILLDILKQSTKYQNESLHTDISDNEDNYEPIESKIDVAVPNFNNLTCKFCQQTFDKILSYKEHMQKETQKKENISAACTICNKSYTKKKLANHMKVHGKITSQKSFQCDICGKNYQSKRNLSRHYLSHTGMPHVCEVCGKGFREASLLKDHLNVHNGLSPYLCNLCGKSYPTGSALRLHRAYKHEGKKRKGYKYPKKSENCPIIKHKKASFPCEVCGKIYASRTIVNYHVLTHGKERKFQCNDCGKMFANKSILGDHRRIHRLSYKCTYCNRAFAYAASLETHINSHTGNKPHACTICGKRYSNRSHLKEHTRNHTGERPYICNICGKTFAVKGNLNGHLKIHTK